MFNFSYNHIKSCLSDSSCLIFRTLGQRPKVMKIKHRWCLRVKSLVVINNLLSEFQFVYPYPKACLAGRQGSELIFSASGNCRIGVFRKNKFADF